MKPAQGTSAAATPSFRVEEQLAYCAAQARKTVAQTADYTKLPRRISAGKNQWEYVDREDWTSGFWPGTLWYLYQQQPTGFWKEKAEGFTQNLAPVLDHQTVDHDLGFMFYSSYGNGYRLTKDPAYKQVLLRAADSLATLFNPRVGTILSWPRMVKQMGWPHNTIMDNMINLELLFWASKNGGRKELYDMAVSHARVTSQHHFRPDGTSYHVAVYDDKTGQFLKGVTHQGYADNSMWARGQAWAIYGFTMCYRESREPEFLDRARKSADVFIRRLPEDQVPYWDFDAPDIPQAPRDASAAAIVASALLELSTLVPDQSAAQGYRRQAEKMLATLSSAQYQARNQSPAFLLHSTGHKPNGTEIDASLNYADYYYLEALLRLQKLQQGKPL
ncbi:glycoside hydrolase family 88 protein [Hymenobacter sp. GOD-10R]|uniref:glycoside hydrolase family 88 protein n=1 Tax=Hymenobacter sp. GOD-10R TaxID=3093922 RepID=UPI002D7756EB|nr:glycoside hydrolase family 88 protein [Hymenobacter sp. GOD-10R]WRQ31911.1 glycoside hydrolase family 88 protein [Hymenobacter sp. GOD-10R]